MCGIAGVLTTRRAESWPADAVAHMLELQRHRGPDDRGVWSGDGIALGNTRLSILDLSPAGRQPILSPDGSICVVHNGEIYNFESLRHELRQSGYVFRSECDTEVLLYGYQHWGVKFLWRLRGMFAIALWDARAQRLLLARDRFGIKPLYYRVAREDGATTLTFASEIKPLLALQAGSPQPNLAVVHDFLAHGLLDHTQETFFQGIAKVPPAHHILADRDGHMTTHRYWDIEFNSELESASSTTDAAQAQAFRAALSDTIRHHLVSDVPVGSCLSGGLDSSAIVCSVHGLLRDSSDSIRTPVSDRLLTFTSAFDDLRYDERSYVHHVLRQTGAEGNFVFPTVAGFLEELPNLLHHQEEPFGGTSIYAQWCLMRAIHEKALKVVLDGQGGDELLLGYGKFYLFYLQTLLRDRQYRVFAREGLALLRSRSFWQRLDLRHGLRYMGRLAALTAESSFVGPALAREFAEREIAVGLSRTFAERIKLDVTTLSLPVLLRYEDKNSMAFSVESRVPFVDHVLAEQVAALPVTQKLRNGWTKFILRQALGGVLPEPIRWRKTKFGFETPEQVWLRGELGAEFERTFAEAQFLPQWAKLPRLRETFASYRKRPGLLPIDVFFRYFIVERWAAQFLTGANVARHVPAMAPARVGPDPDGGGTQ